jgi:hypothetical protein
VSWLFPDRQLSIEAPCLDCGEPIRMTVTNGEIQDVTPGSAVVHVNVPLLEWRDNWPYT